MLDNNTALVIIIAVVVIAWNARWAIEALAARRHPAPQATDLDELADRIEQAIINATSDLLAQLELIGHDTTAIRDSNDRLVEQRAQPEPRVDSEPLRAVRAMRDRRDDVEATDLTKPDPSQSGYQPTDLR